MKPFLSVLAGAVLGVLVLLTGIWLGSNQNAQPIGSPADFPDQFFRSAMQLGPATSWPVRRKQELLREAARYRQTKNVAATGIYWADFQKDLAESHGNEGAAESELLTRITALVDFQDQLEQALTESPEGSSFEIGWATWLQVDTAIRQARERALGGLAKQVTELPAPAGDSLADVIQEFRLIKEFLRANQTRITTVIAATPPTEPLPNALLEVLKQVQAAQSRAVTAVTKTHAEISNHLKQLGDGTHKVDPAAGGEGTCSVHLNNLSQIQETGRASEFEAISALRAADETNDEVPADNISTLDEAILAAEHEASRYRQLAYNLWALREIHAAGSVDSWSGPLGQIDTGYLELEVSALYSSTYGRRIDEVKDPAQRSATVQSILINPKVALTSF